MTTILVGMALLALPAAAPAQAVVPGGGSLLAWLGLTPGDRLTYATTEGERACVDVGDPLQLGGRSYAPLVGLPWPGLATDSQVFVPLDGTLGIGVIRTPSLRPAEALDWLLGPITPIRLLRGDLADPGAMPVDGWYAIGDSPDDPSSLVYVACRVCEDAGTYVQMERGRGITKIEERTIAGPRRLVLVGRSCPRTGWDRQCPPRGTPAAAPRTCCTARNGARPRRDRCTRR